MIPKTIYYVWFGKKPLPKMQKDCIKSWARFFPDYSIIKIDETNFDVNQCKFSKIAYKEKWYNFVSDYARVKVIYDNGGLYFDTDVKVINDFREIIGKGPFFSFCSDGLINTGLGFACEKGNKMLNKLIRQYENWNGSVFHDCRGFSIVPPCPFFNREVFERGGVVLNNTLQFVDGIYYYPSDFFEAFDNDIMGIKITNNTKCIHLYAHLGNPSIDIWYLSYRLKLSAKVGKELPYKYIRNRMILFHPIKYFRYHRFHKYRKRI